MPCHELFQSSYAAWAGTLHAVTLLQSMHMSEPSRQSPPVHIAGIHTRVSSIRKLSCMGKMNENRNTDALDAVCLFTLKTVIGDAGGQAMGTTQKLVQTGTCKRKF